MSISDRPKATKVDAAAGTKVPPWRRIRDEDITRAADEIAWILRRSLRSSQYDLQADFEYHASRRAFLDTLRDRGLTRAADSWSELPASLYEAHTHRTDPEFGQGLGNRLTHLQGRLVASLFGEEPDEHESAQTATDPRTPKIETRRQRFLELHAQGETDQAIAGMLKVSVRTVYKDKCALRKVGRLDT